jgi:hypothetical protein
MHSGHLGVPSTNGRGLNCTAREDRGGAAHERSDLEEDLDDGETEYGDGGVDVEFKAGVRT